MCGIAGIISFTKMPLNIEHLNILGTLNDERGGDSCGIFIDKNVEYGIKDTALFRTLTRKLKYPQTSKIALVHCRKTSTINKTIIEQAQPVVIKEDNDIKFVLLHNGTITNALTLANKYIPDFNTKQLSDSQIIAQIIYEKGYDVLEEYNGTAVFCIIDYRIDTPKVLFFKGNSIYNDTGEKEERPLYLFIKDNTLYFSSMSCALHCIDHTANIQRLNSNLLVEFDGVNLKVVEEFDRTKLTKKSVYKINTNYKQTSSYIIYNNNMHLYTRDNIPVTGKFDLYPSGFIANKFSIGCTTCYFVEGRLLINKECYEYLIEILESNKPFYKQLKCLIDYFSYSPILINNKYMIVNDKLEYEECKNASWSHLFNTPLLYYLNNGKLRTESTTLFSSIMKFKKECKKRVFDFNKLDETVFYTIFKTTI